jgi:hypothetical protein
MKWPKPYFDRVVFELRYAKGHRYLDRCGETLIEIEEKLPGWVPQEISPSRGSLINLDKDISFTFSSYKLDASQNNPKATVDFREQLAPVVDIICKCLDLSQFIRIGVRFHFLLAAHSMEQAEEMVRQTDFVTLNPKLVDAFGPNIKAQKHIVIFEHENVGRRIEFGAVRREEGKLPLELLAVEPRLLPKGQREILARKLEHTKRYGEDPRFALQFDIDNYEREPESFNVRAFIEGNDEFARQKLFPLLGVTRW